MYKNFYLLVFFIFTSSFANDSVNNIYEEYNKRVIEGISFEDEKKYYASSKVKEIELSLTMYMEQMGKSKEEVIEFFQGFSQSVAKCKKIKLEKEEILKDGIILVYSQSDICGNKTTDNEKHIVKMIDENGWKITSIKIGL